MRRTGFAAGYARNRGLYPRQYDELVSKGLDPVLNRGRCGIYTTEITEITESRQYIILTTDHTDHTESWHKQSRIRE